MAESGEEEPWHGLDEGQARLHIRKLLKDIELNEVESYPRLIRQFANLRRLVQEEIGAAFQSSFSAFIEQHDCSTVPECRQLAARADKDLTTLGLAIKHPKTGAPAKLGVALSPPPEGQSWLQIQPLDASADHQPLRLSAPFLLGRPMKELELIPEPPRQMGPPGRGTRQR
jgi:hypothetical protein